MKKGLYWFMAIMAATLFSVSCCRKDGKGTEMEEVVKRVWRFAQSRPDGFTVDVRTMKEPSEGIAVSYSATQRSHSRESLYFVVSHALGHDGYVGGWLDGETGLYYFDSTRLFPEDRLDEALAFARENNQTAVYIISTREEIRVDELLMAA